MQLLRLTFIFVAFHLAFTLQAQQNVGIGTTSPHTSAILDITSTNKGVLIPRIETSAVVMPATGLLVFQPSDFSFYYYSGVAWKKLDGGVVDSDGDTKVTAGNHAGTQDSVLVEIDNLKRLVLKRNSGGDLIAQPLGTRSNTFYGFNAGRVTSTGQFNTAFGESALKDNLGGNYNTGLGYIALGNNTNGVFNTAVGEFSLGFNTTGGYNTALGGTALVLNTTGSFNVAAGYEALKSSTTANSNVAIGRAALGSTMTREHLVAIGDSALYFNETGAISGTEAVSNTAIGTKAMLKNTVGGFNTAVGDEAMKYNTTGSFNTALGSGALFSQQGGLGNTAIGQTALYAHTSGNANTVLGLGAFESNTIGSANIGLGWNSGGSNISGSNNIFIGTQAGQNELGSNKLYIENSSANEASALIYGEFNTNLLRLNAHTEVNIYDPGHVGVKSIIQSPPGTNIDLAAVHGENTVDDFYGYGVYGKGGYIGVYGEVAGTGQGGQSYYGMLGNATGSTTGTNYGVYGAASNGGTNYGGYFIGKGYFSDNVGIGINQPAELLHLRAVSDPTILIKSIGNGSLAGKVSMRQSDDTGMDIFYDGTGSVNALVFETFTGGTSNGRKMTMDISGNVGIGITENIALGHKLSVNGKIACTEVRVQPQSAWPDYVFSNEYKLMSLEELKNSIAQNNHLPGIPSAADIKTEGLQVGEMQVRMMEKIEELTLYIIQLNTDLQILKEENQQQATAISNLMNNK